LQRVIDEQIKKPLSREILFGSLANGGIVELSVDGTKLKLNIVDVLPVSKVKNDTEETEDQ
jgi:ATP-dependent Clp protease ATP-binding subunit ClpA